MKATKESSLVLVTQIRLNFEIVHLGLYCTELRGYDIIVVYETHVM